MFYYLNGKPPLTNGLLIVPKGEVPEGTEKINLKFLFEMFRGTNSHGLGSIQFISTLGIFFGLKISIPKNAITELYRNFSYETYSGARDHEFQAISNLVGYEFSNKNHNIIKYKKKGGTR